MNRRVALFLAFSTATALAISGCTGAPPAEKAQPVAGKVKTYQIDGYPLDRSLAGLAGMTSLQTVAILTGVKQEKSVWLTPDGAAPELPVTAEGDPISTEQVMSLVTPFSGTISKVLRGTTPVSSDASFLVTGGKVDQIEVKASPELAPDIADLVRTGSVLVAGDLDTTKPGITILPKFAYSIGQDGDTLTSLMDSAGGQTRPVFSLADLEARLAAPKN